MHVLTGLQKSASHGCAVAQTQILGGGLLNDLNYVSRLLLVERLSCPPVGKLWADS